MLVTNLLKRLSIITNS